MKQDNELRIDARGLSNPGPRMMVETARARGRYNSMRVVVSSVAALDDLRSYFESLGASVETDHIGDDYHILADLTPQNKT